MGESAPKGLLNQLLAADIQFKFDVMLRDQVSPFLGVQVPAHERSYRLSSPDRRGLRVPQIELSAW
jgi:hypothetical protein